jgi:hypothetical protein
MMTVLSNDCHSCFSYYPHQVKKYPPQRKVQRPPDHGDLSQVAGLGLIPNPIACPGVSPGGEVSRSPFSMEDTSIWCLPEKVADSGSAPNHSLLEYSGKTSQNSVTFSESLLQVL